MRLKEADKVRIIDNYMQQGENLDKTMSALRKIKLYMGLACPTRGQVITTINKKFPNKNVRTKIALNQVTQQSSQEPKRMFRIKEVRSLYYESLNVAKRKPATAAVFSFWNEDFPYRTQIPGRQLTLKQYKHYLPMKGDFRYFFKAEHRDPLCPVSYEEIVNDADTLPLFEGKVIGLIKPQPYEMVINKNQ